MRYNSVYIHKIEINSNIIVSIYLTIYFNFQHKPRVTYEFILHISRYGTLLYIHYFIAQFYEQFYYLMNSTIFLQSLLKIESKLSIFQ